MKSIIIGGLAAGAITVLICTSSAGEWIRNRASQLHERLGSLFNCCFCTSWWVSIAMLEKFTLVEWAATVAIANITVLLIHLGMATVGDEDNDLATELVRTTKLQLGMEAGSVGEIQGRGDRLDGVCSVHGSGEQPGSHAACKESVEV